MSDRRILDGIMRNIYRSDPGKLAAWKAAIHVERDPVVSVVIEQEQ